MWEADLNATIEEGRWVSVLRDMTNRAAGNQDIVWGKALGPKPKYFLVGDQPVTKDYIVNSPFSGGLNPILISAFQTLREKYGATPEDCYITYAIKTTFRPGVLTEEAVFKDWLPILQVEYQLSKCSDVVALGRMARTLAGHIPVRPAIMGQVEPSLFQRVRRAWEAFRG